MLSKNTQPCNRKPSNSTGLFKGGSSNTPLPPQVRRRKAGKGFALSHASPNFKNRSQIEIKNNQKSETVDISIDYLMGVIRKQPYNTVSALVAYLQDVFDCALEYQPVRKKHGSYVFLNQLSSPLNGLKLFYNDDGRYNIDSVTLAFVIPGKPLRTLSVLKIIDLVKTLTNNYQAIFTRIDVRLDDYKKRVAPLELWELVKKGDVAGSRKWMFMSSGAVGDHGESGSDSLYLGSKRRQINIYNAEFLHGISAIRWEGRFREDRATSIINYLVNTSADIQDIYSYLGNKILSIAKFVVRGLDFHQSLDRFAKYEFYESLLQDVGVVDPELLKLDSSPKITEREFVVKTFDWLHRQVFKRLLLLKETFGDMYYDNMLDICFKDAAERYSDKDKILKYALQDLVVSISTDSFTGLVDDCVNGIT